MPTDPKPNGPTSETLLDTARRIVPGVEWRVSRPGHDLHITLSITGHGYHNAAFPPDAELLTVYKSDRGWRWRSGVMFMESRGPAPTPEAALTALRDAIRAEAGRLLAMVGEALPEVSDGE